MKTKSIAIHTISVIMILLLSYSSHAEDRLSKPELPYYDWGACPFECCTYKEWTASKDLIIYQKRSEQSPIVFHVKKGQSIRGVSGVVITTQYGVTTVIKSIQIGYAHNGTKPELSLKPGEVVYTLHYLGEGFDLFWYNGKVYSDQISVPENAWGTPPYSQAVRVLSRPKYEWWALIEDKAGSIGWSKETSAFLHVDSCE